MVPLRQVGPPEIAPGASEVVERGQLARGVARPLAQRALFLERADGAVEPPLLGIHLAELLQLVAGLVDAGVLARPGQRLLADHDGPRQVAGLEHGDDQVGHEAVIGVRLPAGAGQIQHALQEIARRHGLAQPQVAQRDVVHGRDHP